MIPDGTYTAVVDRVEDGVATLEVQSEHALYELAVAPTQLPPDARHPDAVLCVRVAGGEFVDASYNPDATAARRERAQERFDRLSRRLSDDESQRPPDDES